jgi:hypothetical protein
LVSTDTADRLEALALGLRIPGCFACFVSDDFLVFLTDAITSALLVFLPRSGDGAEIHGKSDLRRSKKSELQP